MALAPNFLDALFAEETDAIKLTQKISNHPRFSVALAKGLESEAENERFRVENPGIKGGVEVQKGRSSLLNSLRQADSEYEKGDDPDAFES